MAKRNIGTSKSAKTSPAKPKAKSASVKVIKTKPAAAKVRRSPPKLSAPVVAALDSSKSALPAQKPAPALHNSGPEAVPMQFVDRGLPLPNGYALDRLVALVRDPQWLHAYWELNGTRLSEVVAQFGQAFVDDCAWALRIHRIYEGTAIDVEIDPASGNWYLQVGSGGRFQLELGLLSPDGEWISLAVSQIVETPLEGPSSVIDDEWRLRPEGEAALQRKFELSETSGVSSPLGASRLQSSFALASSRNFVGSSASGRPVAGSWALSFQGASRVSGSSASGGIGWSTGAGGALEPQLQRPLSPGSGPNWNIQSNLPASRGKTQQPNFKVKLPRLLQGVPLPTPTWPPADVARVAGRRAKN